MDTVLVLDAGEWGPEALIDQQLGLLKGDMQLLSIRYTLRQYWLPGEPQLELNAYCCLRADTEPRCCYFAVTPFQQGQVDDFCRHSGSDGQAFEVWCEQQQLFVVNTRAGLPLLTAAIAKPWGQEIWYTGIEERGLSGVGNSSVSAPLPWVLSVMPGLLCGGRQRSLILLKILDPLAEPVFGDLYFELHQQKREVYVVTAVDPVAWPDGVGGIRYGFSQQRRAEYASDELFREAYLQAVQDYRAVREQIDGCIDAYRRERGVAANEPVMADTMSQWMALAFDELGEEYRQRELRGRQQIESFTEILPLAVGDVLKVPLLTPHALQHGVRTVEFQPPVYERLILSFAQKVLTQTEWDTEQAVQLMDTSPAPQQALQLLSEGEGAKVERVVDFEDFEVRRVILDVGARWLLPSIDTYALLMVVAGHLDWQAQLLKPEQALLISSTHAGAALHAGRQPLTLLLALPK